MLKTMINIEPREPCWPTRGIGAPESPGPGPVPEGPAINRALFMHTETLPTFSDHVRFQTETSKIFLFTIKSCTSYAKRRAWWQITGNLLTFSTDRCLQLPRLRRSVRDSQWWDRCAEFHWHTFRRSTAAPSSCCCSLTLKCSLWSRVLQKWLEEHSQTVYDYSKCVRSEKFPTAGDSHVGL